MVMIVVLFLHILVFVVVTAAVVGVTVVVTAAAFFFLGTSIKSLPKAGELDFDLGGSMFLEMEMAGEAFPTLLALVVDRKGLFGGSAGFGIIT